MAETKIATFNINGIRARLPRLLDWLKTSAPDIVCLQELKAEDDQVPRLEIEALGYHVETHGQKGFNGVALLSKTPMEDVRRGLPGMEDDPQARYIEATSAGLRVASIYAPNGNPVNSEKFAYKLRWLDALIAHAADLLAQEIPAVLAGDYNIIPEEEDCHEPDAWRDDALFQPQARARFRQLRWQGWVDPIRQRHPDGDQFTFWDYKGGAWTKDYGIRIDHLLLSPPAADRLDRAEVDRMERGREKASDHAPVWITLKD
ncbi:MAG: exodeoxyribonuclease III [Alphaproteobacteria bacterium]|nr:MAG: exodeoxyribonuclease III [Alphaproteobacteria bacterium]